MIHKILCPVDLSDIPSNAIEYAANMASRLEASLTLINVSPLPVESGRMEENISFGGEMMESKEDASASLKAIAQEVQQEIGVSCEVKVSEETYASLQNIIGKEARDTWVDLVVMGTKGMDSMRNFLFGNNTYKVIKQVECPVLAIPEDVNYKSPENIVYASNYRREDEFSIEQLQIFVKAFDARLTLLHVSEHDSDDSKEAYEKFCSKMTAHFEKDGQLHFERIIDDNPTLGIDTFVHKNDVDMLALTTGPHRLINDLFHKSMAKRLTSIADYPLLVFHR